VVLDILTIMSKTKEHRGEHPETYLHRNFHCCNKFSTAVMQGMNVMSASAVEDHVRIENSLKSRVSLA